MATEVGAITSNEIVAVPAFTVIRFAVSGAVSMTVTPLAAESVPSVVVQAALPGACVRLTSSPTPIVVLVRAPGDVTTVWLVMASGGGGTGGIGTGGIGTGGVGPGGVGTGGVGTGGVGTGGVGPIKRVSSAPIVCGPTRPSINIPEAC